MNIEFSVTHFIPITLIDLLCFFEDAVAAVYVFAEDNGFSARYADEETPDVPNEVITNALAYIAIYRKTYLGYIRVQALPSTKTRITFFLRVFESRDEVLSYEERETLFFKFSGFFINYLSDNGFTYEHEDKPKLGFDTFQDKET